MQKKKSPVGQRLQHNSPVTEIFKKLCNSKNTYLCHRWQIEHDKVKWENILQLPDTTGPIFHVDFSENISGTPKYEVQSAHFNKSQYSLHVTVAHESIENKYFYHFSDMTQDFAFMGTL